MTWPTASLGKPIAEHLLQLFKLRDRVHLHVRMPGVMLHEILVVLFSGVERFERFERRDDRPIKCICLVELINVSPGDALVVFIGVEDRRAVLSADVGALPIELRRVVRGEENAQQLSVADLRRVIANLNHFRVIGLSAADGSVVSRLR